MPIDQHVNEPRQDASSQRPCQAASATQPDQADTVQLYIGLKDNRVYMAIAYWVQGQTLHYITPHGSHNQVSLELVNRKLSARLNAGRLVEFVLPP